MSWDVGVKAKREVEIFECNITYNLSDMYYKCIDGGLKALDEMSCDKSIPILNKAINDLIDNEEEYKKLNPPNGWGTYSGLLEALKELRDCCENNPDGIIEVS